VDLSILISSRAYNDLGIVVFDAYGRMDAAYSSLNLCWANMTADRKESVASLTA
jgi:hypothetical protein